MGGPLRFRHPAEWRRWLEDHHATESEALLFIYKKDALAPGIRYLEALEEALCFGWIDGKVRAHDAETFVLRFTPRRSGSVWSEPNRERVARLIREHRMESSGLAQVREAKRSGAWTAAARLSRVPRMSRDLGTALRADPVAWAHFRAWGASYRSGCVRWVLDAKRSETRERRIRRIVQRAHENQRPSIEGF